MPCREEQTVKDLEKEREEYDELQKVYQTVFSSAL